MDYLGELQEKKNNIDQEVENARATLNSLIILQTKIQGAIEHKQYEIEKEKEKQEGDVRKESKKKK